MYRAFAILWLAACMALTSQGSDSHLNATEKAVKACFHTHNSDAASFIMEQHCQQHLKDRGLNRCASCLATHFPQKLGSSVGASTLTYHMGFMTISRLYLNMNIFAKHDQSRRTACLDMAFAIDHEIGHVAQTRDKEARGGYACENTSLPVLYPEQAHNAEDDADLFALYTTQAPCLYSYHFKKHAPHRINTPKGYLTPSQKAHIADRMCQPEKESLYKHFIKLDQRMMQTRRY